MSAEITQAFRVERDGDFAVITPLPETDDMYGHLIEQAAPIVLAPLKDQPPAGLVIDLSRVKFVRSAFLSFLLRCHTLTKRHGTQMVLAEPSESAQEVLRMTNLDSLWPVHATRAEALRALGRPD